MKQPFNDSPQWATRLAGVFYLVIIALGLFGEVWVRGTLVVSGDPAATAAAIRGAPMLWRWGIAGDLLMHVLDVPVIVVLYLLLRPVSKSLALLATGFNIVQTAVLVANKLHLLVPLELSSSSIDQGAFTQAQLQVLSYQAIQAHTYGFAVGLIFFGVACLVRGYLLFRAGYFPRWLGVLIPAAGVSYLINSFALLVAPSIARILFPAVLVPAFVGELAFALWLTIKGVDLKRWDART